MTLHTPVMLKQVIDVFDDVRGQTIVDATFGAGGYTLALLAKGANVVAIDRDPVAGEIGAKLSKEFPDRFKFFAGEIANLSDLLDEAGHEFADGVVMDVGVSTMQLTQAHRGFSFMHDGPLDMRMSGQGVSAADVVNNLDQVDLMRIISIYGEEKRAKAIAARIVKRREDKPFSSTLDLANLIAGLAGRRHGSTKGFRIHPATRTFQALRIYVNQELAQLVSALYAAEKKLRENGKLVVVTFHSLEDRIVKRFFAASEPSAGSRHLPETAQIDPTFFFNLDNKITKKKLFPDKSEIEANPKSRSAKLRWGVRTGHSPREVAWEAYHLPRLPKLDAVTRADSGANSRGGGVGRLRSKS